MGGFIYSSRKNVKTVELYHLEEKKWSSLPELQLARDGASSCCHGGYIYIFGGFDGRRCINKIERLHLSYL